MTERIGKRYEVLETLGVGGQATVLKARDRQHDRLVALKVYELTEHVSRDALLTEARVLLRLRPHPGLPLVRDDFFDGDRYVIVMDWVDGADLERVLRERGDPGLPYRMVLGYVGQVAAALDHLHAHDPRVVHGDVKPANVIVSRAGDVVLVDFGLAAFEHRKQPAGTLGYTAPEVAAGQQPTAASDIFGLAATTAALLTGRAPDGTRPAWEGIERAHVAALVRALRRALAIDPAARPATAGELVERLGAGQDATLPTGTVTFLVTEIVDAEVLWAAHADAMGALHEQVADLVMGAVESHGGHVLRLSSSDDTTTSVFGQPSAAAKAALALHRAVDQAHWPRRAPLALRVALHSGEAELRDGDYRGVAPRVARRLVARAPAGGTAVSAAAAALTGSATPPEGRFVPLAGEADPDGVRLLVAEPSPGAPTAQQQPAIHASPDGKPTGAGAAQPTRAATGPAARAWRDRVLSPPVARALVSPLGIAAAGAGGAAGIAVWGVRAGVVGGVLAWLIRVAAAIPRSPRPVEPYALDEPWRGLVQQVLDARRRFDAATGRVPRGQLRDRLRDIARRVDDGVAECWRVAQRGQALTRARAQLDAAGIRRRIAELQGDQGPEAGSAAASAAVRALQAQLATAERMDQVIRESRDRITLTEARLSEAVARVLGLSAQADLADLRSLGADVEELIGELEALHRSLAQTGDR